MTGASDKLAAAHELCPACLSTAVAQLSLLVNADRVSVLAKLEHGNLPLTAGDVLLLSCFCLLHAMPMLWQSFLKPSRRHLDDTGAYNAGAMAFSITQCGHLCAQHDRSACFCFGTDPSSDT